jgi:hypothetical protein
MNHVAKATPLTKPRSRGGLLLLRRKAPLPRRSVAYFYSGAHILPDARHFHLKDDAVIFLKTVLGTTENEVSEDRSGGAISENTSLNNWFTRSCKEVISRNGCHLVSTVIAIHLHGRYSRCFTRIDAQT